MKILPTLLIHCFALTLHADDSSPKELYLLKNDETQTISVCRKGETNTSITQNARPGFRPYLHPIIAPDGKASLTQFSPGHHKHQTGVYWAFTRVNGRDYFHNPEETHWKRQSLKVLNGEGSRVSWQTVYHLLAEDGSSVMEESQIWTVSLQEGHYSMDLEWTGKALVDVTVEKYNYGGLFLRMPYEKGAPAEARNAQAQRNKKTEGAKSAWVHVGMKVPGRNDWGNIAVFDHPNNPEYPNHWRVDGQFGFGPASARGASWTLSQGQSRTYQHRFLVYTGTFDQDLIDRSFKELSEEKGK